MSRSMTAFASEKMDFNGYLISWEMRSVNHRYLDLSLRLPDSFRFLEPDIRSIISNALKRGKIDCSLQCKKTECTDSGFNIDHGTVERLFSAIREIESSLEKPRPCSALEVLAWPGVIQEPQPDSANLTTSALKLLELTLKSLVETRVREGAKLAKLIEDRCALLSEQIGLARDRMPIILQNIRESIEARLREVACSPDSDRLEQEFVYLTQKLDVSEELDRLNSHIEEVKNVLKSHEPIGRRLDFLMQELNREANTLGSKSADSQTTQACVEMKVLIEQMREQVQNIE